jgi:sugar phosphate isomerase/epimerase
MRYSFAKSPPERSFECLKLYIRHVHVHDAHWGGNGRVLSPIGDGEVDHIAPLRLLKNAGYSGFLSGEWINRESWEIHLPREIARLKVIENNGAAAQQGSEPPSFKE